jgi:type II restriction enzyme
MQYTPEWTVRNLLLVPSFFFSVAAVEKRAPLSPTARRAGWVGCNILLSQIAVQGKISLVAEGSVFPATVVRSHYHNVRPLTKLNVNVRGWTLDVLRLVQRIGSETFELHQLYDFEPDLSSLHPGNKNVRPKIRQQIQVLRDLDFVKFLGRGRYRLVV